MKVDDTGETRCVVDLGDSDGGQGEQRRENTRQHPSSQSHGSLLVLFKGRRHNLSQCVDYRAATACDGCFIISALCCLVKRCSVSDALSSRGGSTPSLVVSLGAYQPALT